MQAEEQVRLVIMPCITLTFKDPLTQSDYFPYTIPEILTDKSHSNQTIKFGHKGYYK